MDKNIIKSRLTERFVSEEVTPGIAVTAKANKESGKINKAGVTAIAKDVTSYEKGLEKKDPDMSKMATNKYNYTNAAEKTYHEEMEILNGQEMVKYASEPGKEFSQRAKEAIEGSSRMGNAVAANAEESQGSAKDNFGKELVKRVKDSEKKRNIADAPIDSLTSLGDKIAYPNDKVSVTPDKTAMSGGVGKNNKGDMTPQTKSVVTKTKIKTVKENIGNLPPKKGISEKTQQTLKVWVETLGAQEAAKKLINRLSQTGMISDLPDTNEYGQGLNKVASLLSKNSFDMAFTSAKSIANKLEKKAMRDMMGESEAEQAYNREMLDKKNMVKPDKISSPNDKVVDYQKENNNNNNPQIKESMKRLKFKKEFDGSNTTQKIGHALTLIPEGYKTDNKEFEMTDGNVSFKVRWEGTLTEGKAVVVTAKNAALVNEDIARMKALFGYKSQDTLGLVKGKSRIDENAVFSDILSKTKKLLGEAEDDIEGVKPKEGNWEEINIANAPEAKKHVQGTASTDKGTKAPAAKTGSADSIDKVIKHAPEAKKHVQGSVATEKKTNAPEPKEGNWEEINIANAPEAKKDIESGKPTSMATDKAKAEPKAPTPEPKKVKQAPEAKKDIVDKKTTATDKAKVVKENLEGGNDEEAEDDAPEAEDTFNKPDPEDNDSSMDAEPTATDIKGAVPPVDADTEGPQVPTVKKPNVMVNKATGEHFLIKNGQSVLKDEAGVRMPIPPQYVEAVKSGKMSPETLIMKMEDEAENAPMANDDEF